MGINSILNESELQCGAKLKHNKTQGVILQQDSEEKSFFTIQFRLDIFNRRHIGLAHSLHRKFTGGLLPVKGAQEYGTKVEEAGHGDRFLYCRDTAELRAAVKKIVLVTPKHRDAGASRAEQPQNECSQNKICQACHAKIAK